MLCHRGRSAPRTPAGQLVTGPASGSEDKGQSLTLPACVEPRRRIGGGNRGNYAAWGLIQSPGQDREISLYASEAGYGFGPTRLRRFAYRTDGFVSVHAAQSGEFVTHPLRFVGRELELNYRTTAIGGLRVGILDGAGEPLRGFSAVDCVAMQGDEVTRTVRWRGRDHVGSLAGRTVRLHFLLQEADLFALKFNA